MLKYLKNLRDGLFYQTISKKDYSITKKILFNYKHLGLVLIVGLLVGFFLDDSKKKYWVQAESIFIIPEQDTLTVDDLRDYLNKLNIRFVDVAIAQALEETGHFTAPVYKECHNLFGMKFAVLRPRTAKGELRGHAYYDDWQMSCIDYALFQARFCGKIRTEGEYLQFLGRVYAENPKYLENINKHLKKIRNGIQN
jgi:phosphatidylinositol kinase/protein kinase (PI-3  family)